MTYINPRSKLLYHTDRLAELRQHGNTRAPINVEIDLSNRCSHGCAWCHFAHTHTRGPLANKTAKPAGMMDCGDLMDINLTGFIVTQLAQSGVKSVTWSGGGEPTLHPHFDTAVRIAHQHGLDQGLYTNGSHIDDERAQLLKQKTTFVYVSLDECTQETFRQSKGVDRFQQVCDGVARLTIAKGAATIGLGFLLHRNNVHAIDHMVALGRKLGVDYVQFRPTIAYEQDSPDQLVEDTGWINEAIHNLRIYKDTPFVQADISRFEMYRDWTGHPYRICHWAALQTVITPNGMVWRCTNRRGHRSALLGDLTVDSFATIWTRSGGSCAVERDCRVLCRGHIANLTLDAIMTTPEHANFP